MQYKGRPLIPPPRNTKYIPVTVHTTNKQIDMAIVDMETVGDTKYAKIGDMTYFWDHKEWHGKKLTRDYYSMVDVYPEDYKTMTEVPDELDISELTSLSWMFSSDKEYEYEDDSPYSGSYQNGDGGCRQLITAPIMDTSNITDMSNMFGAHISMMFIKVNPRSPRPLFNEYDNVCVSLANVPRYNTENVLKFNGMFYGCESLPKIFPWPFYIVKALLDNGDGPGSFDAMFEKSSVEEVTFVCPNSESYASLIDEKISLEKLDSNGVLKKINIALYEGGEPWKVIQQTQEG